MQYSKSATMACLGEAANSTSVVCLLSCFPKRQAQYRESFFVSKESLCLLFPGPFHFMKQQWLVLVKLDVEIGHAGIPRRRHPCKVVKVELSLKGRKGCHLEMLRQDSLCEFIHFVDFKAWTVNTKGSNV